MQVGIYVPLSFDQRQIHTNRLDTIAARELTKIQLFLQPDTKVTKQTRTHKIHRIRLINDSHLIGLACAKKARCSRIIISNSWPLDH